MRRREGDPYELALALMILGSARGRRGAFEAGRRELQEAARLFVSTNEPSGVALCQGWLVSGGAERHESGRRVDGGKHDADADGQVLEAVARTATLSAVPRQVREDDE